jgi:succinate dehydrogenase / fumarate reductase flavoprotein subunit
MLSYDVLIVGSGGAGLRAAVAALRVSGLSVAVISKMMPTRSATCMAEGGINAVLDFPGQQDSLDSHAFDTVKGSDYLGDQDAIEFFVAKAAEAVKETDFWGTPYSRKEDGRIAGRMMGGHSYPRTNFSADKTGHILLHSCFDFALGAGTEFLMDRQLLDVVVDGGVCVGAIVRDLKTGEIEPVRAKAVILATGGYTRMYWLRTSTPYISTGDGVAAALRAGLAFKDPEMIQFHPTGVAHGGALITEAARGEGGHLLNNQGERFMARYAKDKMELAPRDITARGIETEIIEGRGYGEGLTAYVQLDLRHLGREKILDRLPQIRHVGLLFENVDLVEAPLPIRPTAHYSMGGVDITDFRTMATGITGLYAAGECSCVSIHGANRLGGNSLADAMVTGTVAGEAAAAYAKGAAAANSPLLESQAAAWQGKFREVTARKSGPRVPELRDKLADLLWNKLGIFRTGDKLAELNEELAALEKDYSEAWVGNDQLVYNSAFTHYVEVGNLIQLARSAALAALHRKESRGAHTREDYRQRDDANFLQHSLVHWQDGEYRLSYRPAVIGKYQPEVRKY